MSQLLGLIQEKPRYEAHMVRVENNMENFDRGSGAGTNMYRTCTG